MAQLEDFLEANLSVQIIRITWVDFSGVLRTRFVPKRRAINIASGHDSFKLAQNCMIIPISTAPDCFPTGPELWHAHPDWTSLRLCGFNPKHATVMCTLDKQESTTRFSHCPRTLLLNALDKHDNSGAGSLLVGFEIEFVLLGEDNELYRSSDRTVGYSMTAGLRAKALSILEEILDALALSDISVHQFHTEVSDQLEIALSPLPPLQAIDAMLLAQETIRTICIQHGLKASMSPRPVFHGPQNGCHMHFSLSNGDPELAESFLAGILAKIYPLCALGMANTDSYARVIPDGAGLFVGWGTENRDLPIRKVGDRHWEVRFVDSTANPYLILATLLLAGNKGALERMPLEFSDCNVFVEPMSAETRKTFGIIDDMPKSLRESLDVCRMDADFHEWLGGDMLKQYLAIKDKEIDAFGKMTEEEKRKKFLDYF